MVCSFLHKEFEIFLKIYDWFKHKLMIVHPNTKMMTSFTLFGRDDDRLAQILDYLDTGITGYEMREIYSKSLNTETFLRFSENKSTQLIISTHESSLMDLKILRRDEIWFAEREHDIWNNFDMHIIFYIQFSPVISNSPKI